MEVPKPRHPRRGKYKGVPEKVRQAVIFRASGVCEECGRNEFLEIAHIEPKGVGGSRKLDTEDNLRLLCQKCHAELYHHLRIILSD